MRRYEIEPDGNQCAVSYMPDCSRDSIARNSAVLGIPGLRAISAWEWTRGSKAGLHKLIVAAEDTGKR